jgi:DNA-binding CsgD family transcriptional regulator
MGRSQRVSVLDMSRLVRIHAHLAELCAGSLEWYQQVAEAMTRLTPAQLVFVGELKDFVAGGSPVGVRMFAQGWTSDRARLDFQAWAAAGDSLQTNPVQAALACTRGRIFTRRRIELVPDEVWDRSPIVNTLFRISCVDDNLTAMYRLTADSVFGLSAYRVRGDRAFTRRDRTLMHLFLAGIAPRFESTWKTARMQADLSPRLVQTLELLLQGASEKQIAQQLNLSPHTIHDYVKALHRRFGVASRAELLIAAMGRNTPAPSAAPRM